MMGPIVTSGDSSSLYVLLAIMADPAAAKARLDQIMEASAECQKAYEQAALTAKEAQDNRDAATQALTDADAKLKAALAAQGDIDAASQRLNDQMAKREAEVSGLASETDAREKDLAAREADLASKTEAFNAREQSTTAALDARNAALTAAESEVADNKAHLATQIADYEDRLAKLKALVN